jgi:hypothetical protein
MDEIRFDARAYDPAHVNEVMREARRMRNEVLVDLAKAVFDGRLTRRLFGHDDATRHTLPKGTASQS